MMRLISACVLSLWMALPAFALDPSEMLADPELEAIARKLDFEIRGVKCQSEAIASSNAEWAVDARRAVRELVAEGKSPEEVRAFFLERYGEFALMRPSHAGSNILLWLAGPGLLLVGLGIAVVYVRGRARAGTAPEAALSEAEQARLDEILNQK